MSTGFHSLTTRKGVHLVRFVQVFANYLEHTTVQPLLNLFTLSSDIPLLDKNCYRPKSLLKEYPLFLQFINHPGKFLLALQRGAEVHTPAINIFTNHCVRFFYHMRGKLYDGLAVVAHEFKIDVWESKWKMGSVGGYISILISIRPN